MCAQARVCVLLMFVCFSFFAPVSLLCENPLGKTALEAWFIARKTDFVGLFAPVSHSRAQDSFLYRWYSLAPLESRGIPGWRRSLLAEVTLRLLS